MDSTSSSLVDPRLRKLSSSDSPPTPASSTSATAAARPPSPAATTATGTTSSSQYDDHRNQSGQHQLSSNRQYQTPTRQSAQPHSQSQLQAQQTQAQAQAQARAHAQASAHGHSAHHHSQTPQSTSQHGPVSEFSPDDSASLTPSTPVGGGYHPPLADGTPTGIDGGHDGDPNADPKKPRACESCRGLKVRCEPDPANPDGPCKRCAKAGRNCVITQPTRKRQKKTDNRVAELEKKIDALTASLQARGSSSAGGPAVSAYPAMSLPNPTTSSSPSSSRVHTAGPSSNAGRGGAPPISENTGYGSAANHQATQGGSLSREWALPARDHTFSAPQHTPSQRPSAYSSVDHDSHSFSATGGYPSVLPPITSTHAAGQKRKFTESNDDVRNSSSATPQPPTTSTALSDQPDIIERGVITMVQACEFFARYNDHMAPHLPGVVFPSNMTAAELRRTKPVLFLSVMAAASSLNPPLQRTLTNELMQVFAERVIVTGKKSLELVQALQVAVIWYYPPEHFEELKFYQLLHIAAVMAIDLGLGRTKQFRGGLRKHFPSHMPNHPLRKQPIEDPTSLEARRAWLTCYFLATNSSMALHRPNLIRWTPFMAECVDVLESAPEAALTDGYLCQLILAHKLAEEVGIHFSMDDPASTPNIAEPRTQYALKGFERELDRHITSVPKEKQQPSLRLTFHVLNLYMHEIATQSDFSDDLRPGSSNPKEGLLGTDAPLTAAHINAMSACLTAVDGIFEVFLSLDVSSIRCLPVFNFVRVAYAVVVLMKIYFAASSPKSELGKIINKDHMRVEQHLEVLLDKFRATAADDMSRPAAKFLVVLIMLRSWFQKQKQSGANEGATLTPPCLRNGATTGEKEGHTPCEQGILSSGGRSNNTPEYSSTANTPLQLLSEVATNNSAAASTQRPGSISNLLSSNNPGSGDNGRPPWLGQPSAYIFDPAGAAETAATVGSSAMPSSSSAAPEDPATSTSWMDNTFTPDFSEYANMADGFAHAMDLTLGGLTSTDGSFGGVMMGMMGYGVDSMPVQGRYGGLQTQQETPWYLGMVGGGGAVDGMGSSGGYVPF